MIARPGARPRRTAGGRCRPGSGARDTRRHGHRLPGRAAGSCRQRHHLPGRPCPTPPARGGLPAWTPRSGTSRWPSGTPAGPASQLPGSGRQFGASALKAGGSVFAMLQAGRLVVKLPAERVAELIADGTGGPFGHEGRSPMRQWLVVQDDARWDDLADEALAFAGGLSGVARRAGTVRRWTPRRSACSHRRSPCWWCSTPSCAACCARRSRPRLPAPMAVLEYTGRRSGRAYATCVGVHEAAGGPVVFTEAPWRHNFVGGREVAVRRGSRRRTGRGCSSRTRTRSRTPSRRRWSGSGRAGSHCGSAPGHRVTHRGPARSGARHGPAGLRGRRLRSCCGRAARRPAAARPDPSSPPATRMLAPVDVRRCPDRAATRSPARPPRARPARPSGMRCTTRSSRPGSPAAAWMPVRTSPGATALTRTPWSASSLASPTVSASTPALAAA